MTSPSLRLLATLGVLFLPLAASAAELPILTKARARLGPEAALDGLKSIHYVGTLTTTDPKEPGKAITAKIEMFFQKPEQQRVNATYDEFVETTALEGAEGWTRVQNVKDPTKRRLTLLDPEQVRRLRANTWESLNYFRGVEKRWGRVEDRGTAVVDGIACQKVAFVHGPKIIFFRYFEVATGRLVMTEMDGGATQRESGELMAGGIRFPKTLVQTSTTGDQTRTVTLVYDKVTVNETFPRDLFVFPLYQTK